MNTELRRRLTEQGAVSRRNDPDLLQAIRWAVEAGELERVITGYYALPGAEPGVARMHALRRKHPDAVFTGETAALLHGWPGARTDTTWLTGAGEPSRDPTVHTDRRRIDPEWLSERGSWRFTNPALTALDLLPTRGGDLIDTLLRTRRVPLSELWRALDAHPGRRGNQQIRALLHDSRDEPWSEAERLAHRLLREARITGWRTNYEVVACGCRYFIDIAFPKLKLALEIHGWKYHRDRWQEDQERQANLVAAGWTVMPHTYAMLTDGDTFVERLNQAVRSAARGQRTRVCSSPTW